MDRRSIFEKVKTHLLTQNCKAYGENDDKVIGCFYRTRSGLRCAIGCMIPDGHPGLNHIGGIRSLLTEFPSLRNLWKVKSDEDDVRFLETLQTIHDGYAPGHWASTLDEFEASWL